ncbi:MAG: DUF6316 family protein [Pseudomonadales bacterium]
MRQTDDAVRPHFRSSSRFYQQDGTWFYTTREGEHGPFSTREDAEADARLYAGLHNHLERPKRKDAGTAG